ncbi:response regulator [Rubrolithibacter danxiaensis]|uniref:response regulator n=1 Tax=Rubrolithibacter danxiaensis TaxID=3390805 RepID=UPI003BF82016
MRTRILIVDDHGIMLDGIELLLKQNKDLEIIAKTINANYALAYLRSEKVDLLITDYNMPEMSGLQLLKQAKKIHPGLKIIFLSMHDEQVIVQEVIQAGADGYILKKYAYQEIIQAIDVIKSGGQYWSPEIRKVMLSALRKEDSLVELTDREMDILRLLVKELTSKEIAEKLFISERTIETHRKNLLRKTNSKSTVGLIKYAYTYKLVD